MSNGPEELTERDYVNHNIDDKYEIRVPEYMRVDANENEDASFEAQNVFKETYVMVIDEPREEFIDMFSLLGEYHDSLSVIENYANVQLGYLGESISISEQRSGKAEIQGRDAQIVEMHGSVEGVPEEIAYIIGFVDGPGNVYMIMTWTLESRIDTYRKTLESCIQSFTILGGDSSLEFELEEEA